jgi:hypothetical protein
MNEPIYEIHGTKRRELKKKLGELKRYVRYFWYYHQLDKDMTSFYGGKDGYPMTDESAQKRIDAAHLKIKELEERLNIPFNVNS